MNYTKNQRGFAVIEAFLILIVVVTIGFTGYYVSRSKQTADKTSSSTPTSTTTNATKITTYTQCKAAPDSGELETYPPQCVTKSGQTFTDTSQDSQSKTDSSADATVFIQATYDTYIAAELKLTPNDAQPTGFEGLPAIEDSMTPALYSEITSGQRGKVPLVCNRSQSIPEAALASLTTDTATQSVVNVSLSYNGTTVADGTAPSVAFTVDLASQKITDVKCI